MSVTGKQASASVVAPARLRAREPSLRASLRDLLRDLWVDKIGLTGVTIVTAVILAAIFAPLVAPHDPTEQDITRRLLPWAFSPGGSLEHLLGTDQLGRDILSRIIFGSRASLLVGLAGAAFAGAFGVLQGLIAGYFGGRVDDIIMRWVDIQTAFPGLLMAMLIIVMIGPGLTNVIIVLVINGWMVFARMTRGLMLSVREIPYIEAARCIGCGNTRILFRHALPNLTSLLLTLFVLEMARMILAESTLSFLGLGIQPPDTSWGLMVSDGHDYFMNAWWLITFPGLAIALLVLGVNLVANWLRTVTDPYQRHKLLRAVKAAA